MKSAVVFAMMVALLSLGVASASAPLEVVGTMKGPDGAGVRVFADGSNELGCSYAQCGATIAKCAIICSCDYPDCECCDDCAACCATTWPACCSCFHLCKGEEYGAELVANLRH